MIRLLLVLVMASAWAQAPRKREPPAQPIPYSHKQHLALGLQCKNCHEMPDPGEMMGVPAASKCMTCHQSVKKDSPAIQKLASFARENQPIPWIRVYQIPSYVDFSHKAHLDSGAKCETCHGPVAERPQLWKETDISMGGCMDCHRANRASLDCGYCHEPKN